MNLIWATYQKNTEKPKHQLYFLLGEENGITHVLYADPISDHDKYMLRQYSWRLDKMTIKEIGEWLKQNCPEALEHYRTLKTAKVGVSKTYNIKAV